MNGSVSSAVVAAAACCGPKLHTAVQLTTTLDLDLASTTHCNDTVELGYS